jgi:phosphoadenosine phosphosulfate reductase
VNTIQNTLSGDSLIDVSIQILRDHEPEEGYYVAFSGGKDSIVMYDLVKRSGVKHDVHFSMTTIDPPEIYAFIREHYPEVIWEKPKRSMFAAIKSRQIPPSRHVRYCCSELKELHGKNRVVVTGIRRLESFGRSHRKEYDQSHINKKTFYCHPIVSWSDSDVWGYIHSHNLTYPGLYDEGYDRIGCIMCPLQNRNGILRDATRYPKHYKAYIRAFKKMLQNADDRRDDNENRRWRTPEDVMYWYIYGLHRHDPHPSWWLLPTDPGFDLKKILEKRR